MPSIHFQTHDWANKTGTLDVIVFISFCIVLVTIPSWIVCKFQLYDILEESK